MGKERKSPGAQKRGEGEKLEQVGKVWLGGQDRDSRPEIAGQSGCGEGGDGAGQKVTFFHLQSHQRGDAGL